MMDLLGSVGKTALVTSGTLISLNGQTVPLNISKETSYLQSTSSTASTVAGGTPTVTMTPGVVNSGFSMNFTPKIEGNKVSMRYSIDISALDRMNVFGATGNQIQLPDRSVRNFMNNVKLKSGDTLVLSGFQQVESQATQEGIGAPSLWMLGGSKAATTIRRTLVIVVTPFIYE